MKKYEMISDYLIRFLYNEVTKTGLSNAVVGLSGGIDSAVVAVLAKHAFGDKLFCIKMPSHYSSKSSTEDADRLCKKFDLSCVVKPITSLLKVYEDENPDMGNLRLGNLSARLRMMILFDESAKHNALVLGTSNKSELMLGYGTLYGDLASAVNPIGDMYKSEIYELASYLGVNKEILDKAPSADLWSGQNDEYDLGYTYKQIDEALKMYIEDRLSIKEMLERGIDKEMLDMLISRIYKNHFKRKMPVIAKLTSRTINYDFNYPRDIGL